MALKLKRTSSDEALEYLTALVFGPSGVGKTRLAATLPGRVIVVSTERGGTASLAGPDYDVDYVEVFSRAEAFEAVVRIEKALRDAIAAGKPLPWRSVVFDGVSAFEDAIMAETSTRGGGLVQTNAPEVLSQAGYGVLGAIHRDIRSAFLRLPQVHVVFTALARDKGGTLTPAVAGQQGDRLRPSFSASCSSASDASRVSSIGCS